MSMFFIEPSSVPRPSFTGPADGRSQDDDYGDHKATRDAGAGTFAVRRTETGGREGTDVTANVSSPLAGTRTTPTRNGVLAGLLGALCCIGNAVAVATGLGALAFFRGWMDRYQVYFILGSLAAMALAMAWMVRRSGMRSARRVLLRHAAVMLVAYVVTFALASVVSGVVAR